MIEVTADALALGYELTRRLAGVVAKRLQATRVRLITASGRMSACETRTVPS
jgi:hypothetical protein